MSMWLMIFVSHLMIIYIDLMLPKGILMNWFRTFITDLNWNYMSIDGDEVNVDFDILLMPYSFSKYEL